MRGLVYLVFMISMMPSAFTFASCGKKIAACRKVCTCDDKTGNKCPKDKKAKGKMSSGFSGAADAMDSNIDQNIVALSKVKKACKEKRDAAKTSCMSKKEDKKKYKNKCEKVAKKRIKDIDKATKNAKKDKEKAKKSGDQAKKPGGGGQPPKNETPESNPEPEVKAAVEPPKEQSEKKLGVAATAKTVRQASGAKSEYEKLVEAGVCSIDHTDCASEKTKACGNESAVKACCEGPTGGEGKNAETCPQEMALIEQMAIDGQLTGQSSGGANSTGSKLSNVLDEKGVNPLAEKIEEEKKKLKRAVSGESGFSAGGGSAFSSDSFSESDDGYEPASESDKKYAGGTSPAPVLAQSTQNNFEAMSKLICRQYQAGKLIKAPGFNNCAVWSKGK